MRSRGVLLYALNNEKIDYVKMARFCADQVRQHWKLPVGLVTNINGVKGFDYVMTVSTPQDKNARRYPDYQAVLSFLNHDRMMSFNHTPFDETIVIDTDYVVQSNRLPNLWRGQNLLLANKAHSVDGKPLNASLVRVSDTSVRMYWATILMFDKSPVSRRFFNEWQKSRVEYEHFSALYGYDPTMYRNDYGVTIALQKLTGGVQLDTFTLPYSIPTATADVAVTSLKPLTLNNIGHIAHDVHILNKKSLLGAI